MAAAWFERLSLALRLTRSATIARRYFVVNGFDGALTMLGILVGFHHVDAVLATPTPVIFSACIGAAVALGISGLSSAYISEAAEQQVALAALEAAMMVDLGDSAHGLAARWVPWMIALVNGLAPLSLSLLILSPLWLSRWISALDSHALEAAMVLGLCTIFLLGVFLGRVAGRYWLWSGLRTLGIAGVTSLIILLVA